MVTVIRWLIRLVTISVVLGVMIIGVVSWMAGRSLPDYDADWQVTGISNEVEIVRNTSAIPHIFAASDLDAYYALGFAHAQDRLWQMLTMRRKAQGRLSELFGPRTVEIDDLMRRLDLDGHAARSLDGFSEESQAILAAYADGVNAWLNLIVDEALGRGAPELFLFEPQIEAWRAVDSIAISLLLAFEVANHHEHEIIRARTSLALPDPERIIDILPDAPGIGGAELAHYSDILDVPPSRFASLGRSEVLRDPLHPNWQGRNRGGASNIWAISPARAAMGGALMASDPHHPLTAPALWYLARLDLESGSVIGATVPGSPSVLNGRSEAISWGVAASYLDDIDLYIEQLNPENPEQYRTPDGWAEFETRREVIEVAGEDPVTITLRNTSNGPVIPGLHWNLGSVTPTGHVAALRWTALETAFTTIQTGLRLATAPDVATALRAGEDYVAPSANLMLAGADGEIAMQLIGQIPRRSEAHETQARMPSRGWIEENRWQGMVPFSENPIFVDPSSGALGNTNNKLIDRAFPEHVSFVWGDSQRITRLHRLIEMRDVHTRNSFIEAQLDTVSAAARNLLPLIARDLWFTGDAAPAGSQEAVRSRALDLLAEWNGEMNEHLPEPLIFAAWMRHLQQRLIRDEIGPLADEFWQVEPLFLERVFRNIGGASVWCDIRISTAQETCTDVARLALDEALLELSQTYGNNLESWRWGSAHEALHAHPVLGETRLFSWIVNIRQSISGGDFTLNRATAIGSGDEPYLTTHAAGYRGVYDFADPENSVFVISTGQSGHPLSPHYDDLGELWRRGEYVPMTLDPDLARAGNIGINTLSPRP